METADLMDEMVREGEYRRIGLQVEIHSTPARVRALMVGNGADIGFQFHRSHRNGELGGKTLGLSARRGTSIAGTSWLSTLDRSSLMGSLWDAGELLNALRIAYPGPFDYWDVAVKGGPGDSVGRYGYGIATLRSQ